MYENIFLPVQHLKKAEVACGGFCKPMLVKWEDVEVWPRVNPVNGIITDALTLKPGGTFYLFEAVEKERIFTEEQKESAAGPYMDISVTGNIAGNSYNNTISAQAMMFHRFAIIVPDRDGNQRLIGNQDSGARYSHKYTSDDLYGSRRREFKFTWQHALPAPLYQAQAFNFSVGGVEVNAGSLQLIVRFRVGDGTAPMADGDTVLTIPGMAGKNVLIMADGIGLPIDDGSGSIDWTGAITRHVEKTTASGTATFVGGVNQGEIIEIYAWS